MVVRCASCRASGDVSNKPLPCSRAWTWWCALRPWQTVEAASPCKSVARHPSCVAVSLGSSRRTNDSVFQAAHLPWLHSQACLSSSGTCAGLPPSNLVVKHSATDFQMVLPHSGNQCLRACTAADCALPAAYPATHRSVVFFACGTDATFAWRSATLSNELSVYINVATGLCLMATEDNLRTGKPLAQLAPASEAWRHSMLLHPRCSMPACLPAGTSNQGMLGMHASPSGVKPGLGPPVTRCVPIAGGATSMRLVLAPCNSKCHAVVDADRVDNPQLFRRATCCALAGWAA